MKLYYSTDFKEKLFLFEKKIHKPVTTPSSRRESASNHDSLFEINNFNKELPHLGLNIVLPKTKDDEFDYFNSRLNKDRESFLLIDKILQNQTYTLKNN